MAETNEPAHEAEDRDLGFGRYVAQQARGRFLARDGRPTARKYGLGAQRAERFYLAALAASWPVFSAWLFGGMFLINGLFAAMYAALGPGAIAGTDAMQVTDPFLRAFAFSVGVFTTTGTGAMHAVGSTANWLVAFESLLGPFLMVASGGMLIARLTRPRMRIRFSESAIIAPYEGGRGLMFRMVNVQPSELTDVQVRFNLIWFETTEGKRERSFHQLELERDSVEFFTLHWTVVHPIDAKSPLRGVTPDMLREAEAEFVISVTAHEETFSTRVNTRSSYLWNDIRWDVKWASIFANSTEGIAIDVERLDRTERLDEGATSRPAALELQEQRVGLVS
jgi:inward rectifier potassium channel